jgi:ABC-type sugar transport system substrate-binding protein
MINNRRRAWVKSGALLAALSGPLPLLAANHGRRIAYLSAKQDLPFWQSVSKGIKRIVQGKGYEFLELDSKLSTALQLQNTRDLLARGVAGIVISPVDSESAPEVLALTRSSGVPVVIADIGTQGGDYVSYVKSDNYRGAHQIGVELARALREKGWNHGQFALVTISLARKNGQDRTNGFRDAMKEAGIGLEVGLRQMIDYSEQETYLFVKDLLQQHPNLHGLFIETDQPVRGAMRAIREAHKATRKGSEVLIVSFDAMPEVAELLKSRALVAVGMQQPYLMGQRAAEALLTCLQGGTVPKQILVPILLGTGGNIESLLPQVRQTVFGEGSR